MTLAVLLSLTLAAQAELRAEAVGPAGPAGPKERPVEALARMTAADEGSVTRLSASFRAIEDPTARARALHDWLVTRLRYQSGALDATQAPAQVLARRTANCDGYSRLFEALGKGAGLEVVRIVGVARDGVGRVQAHAWNAVKLEGTWRLVDVTFDDPQLAGDVEEGDDFRTDYFLLTPELAALDHLPTDAAWLLGAPALSRAQFEAQGPDRATTRHQGVRVGATRLAAGRAVVRVENEGGLFLLLRADGRRCGPVVGGRVEELFCELDPATPHHLELFTNRQPTGHFHTAAEWLTAAH